ncbi:DUF3617 domain-containing protein [Aurantiacibacter sp. MUD61]|uniref:DUF3617 domain-containing protein n=1 Tax=Aurantiacibacter sp. MUD61 TaxID=3009083 RepID=UPI0022EFE381|nr:DUF3617 family protein [Aurantiacibacter sp. MUD61]
MLSQKYAILLVLPVLASCAQDIPENPPLLGEWEQVRTLDSVTIDGVAYASEDLPAEMRAFEGTERRCGEPVYTDANAQAEDVASRTGGYCELSVYTHDTDSAEYSGRCEISGTGGEYNPQIRGRSTFTVDTHRDVVTMEGTITLPDQSQHVLKMIAIQEGTRIGDC